MLLLTILIRSIVIQLCSAGRALILMRKSLRMKAGVLFAIWSHFPVLRRKVIHPGAAVDQNEFTVNETVSPLALLFGALTAEGWKPSEELINRQPRQSVNDLPFYSMP